MRDHLHKALKPIKDKSGLWWLFFWKWPELLRECHGEINQLTSDLSMVREKFRNEQSRCEAFEKLANESREMAAAAANRASAEKSLSQNLSEELGYAKVQLQKSSETVGSLENKIARMEMEMERVKAELAKTQADLTRSGLELERERRIQQDTRRDLTLLREFVHRTHRLDIPTRRGVKAMLANGSRLIAFLALLLPMVLLSAPFPPPFFRGVYTTNTAAWAQTNVISLSTTNATSKPLTNHYQDGVLTLFGLEAGANITLSHNGSNIVITGSAGGDAGGTNARQFGTLTLTNLSGTGAVTNVVSLSTTNATSKPITNHFENGILTLYGLEAGANVTLSMNESNIVIASTGGGSEVFFNENQFLPSATHTNIRAGALLTNTVHWQSNALLPALIATNQPGGTVDLFTFLATNGAGIRGTSNGAVVVRGVIGSTTNYFEVRNSNNITPVFAVTHSNTVRIVGPNFGSDQAGIVVFDTEPGTTQTPVHFFTGGTKTGSWRADSSGNQVISAASSGDIYFNQDGGSGVVRFQLTTVGGLWTLIPSSAVAAWHGGTARRGQITNVWDVFVRSNVAWVEVGGTDAVRIQSTNGMSSYTMFLPITNGLAGQVLYNVGGGELSWKDDATGGGALFNPDQFLPSATHTNIKAGAFLTNMNYFGTGTNDGSFYSQHHFPLADDTYNFGSPNLNWVSNYARYYRIFDPAGVRWITLSAPPLSADYSLVFPDAQGANGQVITNNGSGTLGWWTPVSGGGGLTTNANQFGESVELTIKSGVLLTNALFYPSNLTGPATIHLATTAQVTNLTEWRSTNGTINVQISSNANAIVYGRLDMSNAVAFRTNNIDFRLPVYQAFTNALQTNLVLQLTNTYEGVTHRIDAYGAGRLGNGRTNAWQLLCTVESGVTIYWPPGTTNGNFDVLVNSNQVVSLTFSGGLGSTNILAEYRIREGIGDN